MKVFAPRRLAALLVAAFGATVLCAHATAYAVERKPLSDASFELAGLPKVRDTLIHLGVRRAASLSTDPTDLYTTTDGYTIEARSASYDREQVRQVIDVVDSLTHGPELAELSIYVADPAELTGICGAGTLACYAPGIEEMFVSGEEGAVAGVPRDFVIAHEYGHHVANNRSGGIWRAIDAGTTRWATRERVCQLTRSGDLFPGDETTHYWRNPGEAFAESFAHMNFPDVGAPWGFAGLLPPDKSDVDAIRDDVNSPTSGPNTVQWVGAESARHGRSRSGRLRPGTGNGIGKAQALGSASFSTSVRRVTLPLDGVVGVELTASPGAYYRLRLRDPKTNAVLDAARTDDSGAAAVSITSCGRPSLRLEVERVGGATGFSAAITTP